MSQRASIRAETPRRVSRSRVGVAPLSVLVLVVHLAFLRATLIPDEAGFFLVGRDWSLGGPLLYGHYFVDRPPGLIALNWLASRTGHLSAIRVLTALGAALTVVLVAATCRRLGGRPLLAATVATALLCAPTLEALNATGELMALPFVALALLGATVGCSPGTRHRFAVAVGTGVAGAAAVSIKPNMADGAVFAAVLALASVGRGDLTRRAFAAVAAGGLIGGALVLGAVAAAGLVSPAGLGAVWEAAVGFRAEASRLLFRPGQQWFSLTSTDGPVVRSQVLVVLALLTGLLPVLAVVVGRALRLVATHRSSEPVDIPVDRPRSRAGGWPLGVAVATCLVLDVVSTVGGGGYWPHYLLQPVPVLALALAAVAPTARLSRPTLVVATWCVLSALVTLGVAVRTELVAPPEQRNRSLGEWVAASARPGDGATVLFGHADIAYLTGLRSPYEHLWLLPTRVLDPRLTELVALLGSSRAPRFVVAADPLSGGGPAGPSRLRRVLERRYVQLGAVCGRRPLWVLLGREDGLAPLPSCAPRTRQPQWYVDDLTRRVRSRLSGG